MARVIVHERSGKSQHNFDRVPLKGEILSLGPNYFIEVTDVCHFPSEAPADAVVTAVDARPNLSEDIKTALLATEAVEGR